MLGLSLSACALPQFSHPNAPADAQVASSPAWVVEMGNYYLQVTSRATWTTVLYRDSTMTPNTDHPLWGHIWPAANVLNTNGYCWGDARIVYDPNTARWYRTAFWFGPGVDYQLCLAVSVTSDPRGGWWAGQIAQGDFDFMRLSFTNDHIVSLPGDSGELRFVDKWRAIQGDFGGVIARDLGMPFAVPALATWGTGTEAIFVGFDNSGGYPRWRVWRHGVAGNYTVIGGQPWGDPSYVAATNPAWTPNGTIAAGNATQEAWWTGGQVFVTGVLPGSGGVPTAYLATLWVYLDAAPFSVRRAAQQTIFPALAVDNSAGDIVLTAIQTDPFHYPTHMMALTTPQDTAALQFFSVQDAAANKGFASLTPGGNGSGPVPLESFDGVSIRGPDYLWATADQAAGVWFVGMWTAGGSWWSHTAWWH